MKMNMASEYDSDFKMNMTINTTTTTMKNMILKFQM